MSKKTAILLSTLGLAFALPSLPMAQGHDHEHPQAEQAKQGPQQAGGDPYLLDVDPVSGAKLGPVKA